MKKTALIAVGSLGIASSAFAGSPPGGPNEVINLQNFSFATQATGTPSAVQTQTFQISNNPDVIIGFTFEFDYTENPSDASYASDIAMRLSSPSFPFAGNDYVLGGTSFGGMSFGTNDAVWDFNGSGSSPPGHYSHTTLFAPGTTIARNGGTWTADFQAGYNAGVSYSNVKLTLWKQAVPAPGALALLGLAGVAGRGRRRR